jgi:hypothetical protein
LYNSLFLASSELFSSSNPFALLVASCYGLLEHANNTRTKKRE